MKIVISLLVSLLVVLILPANAQSDDFFKEADHFFEKYVIDGKVNYSAIKTNPKQLNRLVNHIEEAQLPQVHNKKKKAFYLNAYNILTINSIINHYPVESPNEIEGFFDGIEHTVAGKSMTLDNIEKGMLYQNYSDSRLHFALVCAANGCPPLKSGVFKAKNLDQQLAQQTEIALGDEDFIRVKYRDRMVEISKIFKWYRQDFLNEANNLLEYLNEHRRSPLPADMQISYYEYDWSLNEVKKK